MILPVIAIALLLAPLASVGGEKSAEPSGKDYDFKEKIVYFVAKPIDSKSELQRGVIEKARVIRLGDRWFLVGQIPEYGEGPAFKAAAGKALWTPISEIIQLTEFKSIAEVKEYFEAVPKPDDKKDH
jgi:hypothetical protein